MVTLFQTKPRDPVSEIHCGIPIKIDSLVQHAASCAHTPLLLPSRTSSSMSKATY